MDRRIFPLFLLLAAWIGLGLWLCNKYICNASPSTPGISQSSLAPAPPAKDLWTFNDQSTFTHSSGERFQFGLSGINLLNQGNTGIAGSVTAAANYLKANPARGMSITGYYLDDEKNNTLMPNLGVARANVVKDMMIAAGVGGKQLSTTGSLLSGTKWVSEKGVMHGINFSFGEATGDSRLTAIKERLFGKPLTLYFKTGEGDINLSRTQRKDLADMMYYLENMPKSKLNIEGHTDSVGNKARNIELSKERAESVVNYLNSKGGIKGDKMEYEGKGPNRPIASNDSSRGRAKNRRVEIVLN